MDDATPYGVCFFFLSFPAQSFQMKLFRLRKLFLCKSYRRKKDMHKVFKCFPLIKINKKKSWLIIFSLSFADPKIARFPETDLKNVCIFFIIWNLLKNKDSFRRLLFIAENLRICLAAPSAYFCLLKQRFLIRHFLYSIYYH